MSGNGYLKDRLGLYLVLAAVIGAFTLAVLVLPYETVYVRDRAYLWLFLGTIVVCVGVLLLGMTMNVLLWLRGSGLTGTPERRAMRLLPRTVRFVFSKRFWKTRPLFVKEALYLSKLKGRSSTRWTMHILILGGFVATFVLDLIVTFSLDIVKWAPMISNDGWAKLWIRDFGFDLAGFMMVVGLMIAAVRRFAVRPKIVRTELPDAVSVLFLLAVVLGGFILEAIGIAGRIPGHEVHGQYSFFGYAISLALPSTAGVYYDQVWLIHGVMSALLIAYIPFSKLFHMVATPFAIEAESVLSPEADIS